MFPRSKWALSPLPGNGREADKRAGRSSWKEGSCSQENSSELMHRAPTAPLPNGAAPPRESWAAGTSGDVWEVKTAPICRAEGRF